MNATRVFVCCGGRDRRLLSRAWSVACARERRGEDRSGGIGGEKQVGGGGCFVGRAGVFYKQKTILEKKRQKRRLLWFLGLLWFLALVSRGRGFCVVSGVSLLLRLPTYPTPISSHYNHKAGGFRCYLAVRPQAHEHSPPTGRAARPDRPDEHYNKPRGASRPCRIKRAEKNRDTKA